MPRLPGPEALGGLPSMRSGRTAPNVGNLDTGASAIAKGLGAVGGAMVGIAEENRKEDDALDLIKADSHLQQGLTELNRQFETDPDHATYGPRYTEGAARIRTEAEGMIRNPQHRERWLPRADNSITSGRDRVLGRGTALAREERYDEIDGILTTQRDTYLAAPDDESRERTRRTMEDSIELGVRSGLVRRPQARDLRRRHVDSLFDVDVEQHANRVGPYEALTELREGDQRGRADSAGTISDQGLAAIRRTQPESRNLTVAEREAANKRLKEETAGLSTYLNENASGLTQLQHDALVTFGHRRGQAALEGLLPDIQTGNWENVARTMATPRQPVTDSGATPDMPGFRAQAGKGPSALSVARQFLGNNEREHADVLAEFFKRSGGQNLNPAQTAWCMAFVNAAIGGSGAEGTGTLMARDAMRIGTPTRDPQEGDIVVLNRGNDPSLGHVGFYVGRNPDGSVRVLGGNQGGDGRVSVESFPQGRVLGYRTPPRAGTQVPGVDANEAANRLLATDNDRAAQEAEMVLGRAPSSRFSGMPWARRNAMVHKLEQAARGQVRPEIEDDLIRIERTGEARRLPDGTTWFDRANRVYTEIQRADLQRRVGEARGRFRAVNGLAHRTPQEMEAHVESLSPGNNLDGEGLRQQQRARDYAANMSERIQQHRNTDSAAAVSGAIIPPSGRMRTRYSETGQPYQVPDEDDLRAGPEPEVAEVYRRIVRRAPEVATSVDEEGDAGYSVEGRQMSRPSVLQRITDGRLTAQERVAMVEARMAAAARLGIPDYNRRGINRQEADDILGMPTELSRMDEGEYKRRLKMAADRAQDLFGRRYAVTALRDALDFRRLSTDQTGERNRLIANLATGSNLVAEDVRRLNSLDQIDRLGRLWEGPPADGLNNFGGDVREDRPGIMRNDAAVERNLARQGDTAQRQFQAPRRQPNDTQKQWLLQNVEERAAYIDRMFEPGTAARIVEEQRRPQKGSR